MYFLSLTPFAKQNAFEIHSCSCVCQEFIPLQKKKKGFFLLLNSVLFMDVKIYPFPSQWTSGLFLIFGYYKWSYCKHLCLGFWMNISFNFTLVNTREWDCCICGDSMFNFVKKKTPKLPNCFLEWLYYCALASSKVWEGMEEFSCSLFSPALGIVRLFQFNYSNRCFVVSYYGFNLRFPNDERCWAAFHCLFAIHASCLVK